jgi:hypothetical protein
MKMDLVISEAWQRAAIDLGIRVEAPFLWHGAEDEGLQCEAHVKDFGGLHGTVLIDLDSTLDIEKLKTSYVVSKLGPGYRTYQRQLFIDTLNDWGWFGDDAKKPQWYTGKSWS